METAFRRDLLAWLAADPVLSGGLNAITEEAPAAASPPWLGIATTASTDWSAKDAQGREVRIALEMECRSDDSDALAALSETLERRVATLPAAQPGYRVVVTQFLRSRAERRKGNLRALLMEWRFLVLADYDGDTP